MDGAVKLMVGFGAAICAIFFLICLKWTRDEYIARRDRPASFPPPSIPLPTIPSLSVTVSHPEDAVLSVPHL